MGRKFVADMAFMSDYTAIKRALLSTSEMISIISGEVDLPFGEHTDLTKRLKEVQAAGTFLSTEETIELRRTLTAITELYDFFTSRRNPETQQTPYPYLDAIAQGLFPFRDILRAIDSIIDRFGNVKDNASPNLREIRRRLSAMSGQINAVMRRVMTKAISDGYIDTEVQPSLRDGRLVLPVAAMNKRRIHGIVHDESATGKTVYIEPAEVVEANNTLRELQLEEHREVIRILIDLTSTIRPHIEDIIGCNIVLGEIDFIRAKAQFAQQIEAHMPSLHEEPGIEWYHAVHPILLLTLQKQGKDVVPLDIILNEKGRILIISGPNAGGKSVCLKTVAVVQYMTQCGLLPPIHENSHIGIYSNIFVDIGDDQSMEDDLSTYSSHLRNMKLFLQKGDNQTLVLIDEFGGGTEPQIGGAIAQAVLQQFNEKKVWGVITTHFQNLKHFAEETEGLINGSMLYDRHLMQPLFRLSIGNPGSSFAIEIARKIGLPESIISEAQNIVGSDYIN
ncbi:MAG: endonuclease MutS2, partial [Muribaculum sp.]|nr:endonuclease MutS2 [Muribaculum sp.]